MIRPELSTATWTKKQPHAFSVQNEPRDKHPARFTQRRPRPVVIAFDSLAAEAAPVLLVTAAPAAAVEHSAVAAALAAVAAVAAAVLRAKSCTKR